jgi:phosphate transport system protein
LSSHLEQQLQRDIDQIRDKVRLLADLTLRALEDSVAALTQRNAKLANEAILRDSRIDDLESSIDAMCVEFMVRHIPVAKHLRFAHSVAKIVVELERIGDYAESINRRAVLLALSPALPDLTKFADLANVAIEMLKQSVRAFLDEDEVLAERTRQLDARANSMHQEIYYDLSSRVPATTEDLSMLFALLTVANRFERVADQAKNICYEVSYIVTGDSVKHKLRSDVNILFVSADGACRSLMAERIGRSIAGDRFVFSSAGVNPRPADPDAVALLTARGMRAEAKQPVSLADLADLSKFKAVVAIGPEAAAAIPAKLAFHTIRLEWDVKRPPELARGGKTPADGYAAVFDDLLTRITELIRALHGTVAASQGKGGTQ